MNYAKYKTHKIILVVISVVLVTMGIYLFFIPPALFPDPANGLQVLRSMQLGSPFNTFASPDQSDISQNYTEFLTWWSPGQYLVPWLFKLIAGLNTGRAIAVTVTIAQLCGITGFYYFFKKIGFTPVISAISIAFIVCQQAFVVPYVYYNGGEVLIFAFEGWFLYGCVTLNKPDLKLLLFILLSGWLGFFLKSSFIWMYLAGLICLWARLASAGSGIGQWIKKGLWIGIPAAISLAVIYITFLSKGQSPASASGGLKFAAETFSFPLASPVLSAFSVDDLLHGLIYHTGKPFLTSGWSVALLIMLAVLSLFLMLSLLRNVPNHNYHLFIIVFYLVAFLFLGYAYLRQLAISYEARHFRLIGILIVPGIIYMISKLKVPYQLFFAFIFAGIAFTSVNYIVKGYTINASNAKGITGVVQPNIDQPALNQVMKLDRENKNAVFVFLSNDIGLEVMHNRIITLPPIGDDLKIDMDDYRYDGFAGPLYIVLPETYNGPKEKLIMKSFPGYTGFDESMLSNNYVLYAAKMKR